MITWEYKYELVETDDVYLQYRIPLFYTETLSFPLKWYANAKIYAESELNTSNLISKPLINFSRQTLTFFKS